MIPSSKYSHQKNKISTKYRFLPILSMAYLTISICTLVLTYKLVVFGAFLLPAAILVFPRIYSIGDIITEVYGYKRFRRIQWESMGCCLFFVLAVSLMIHLPSNHEHYLKNNSSYLLDHLPRVYLAINTGVAIGAFVNGYILSKWKIFLQGRLFWLRSLGSTFIGETIVSLIIISIAFSGVVHLKAGIHMILSLYVFKLFYVILATYPISMIANYIKRKEGIDVFDYETNFNPFSLDIDEEITHLRVVNSETS